MILLPTDSTRGQLRIKKSKEVYCNQTTLVSAYFCPQTELNQFTCLKATLFE